MEDYGATPGRPILIRAEDLTIGYADKIVLSSVRMRMEQGEICGFQGPNGSGKSTLIKACLGLLRPRTGALSVLGLPPGGRGFRSALRAIGYVPQQKAPGELRLTVREAVSMGRYGRVGLARQLRHTDRDAIESALSMAGLKDIAERPVQELSGGQYQRANIARALAMEPDLFILDEPTTHLDARGRDDVAALLETVARGRTAGMLLVSHDARLLALCDRVFEFGSGKVSEAAPRGKAGERIHA